ncbi:MAG TPA: hypothetical protein VFB06_11250 [Streptosporangiaceae bacterium]|nr:hypothetical protein [Streptosporangiaceae bacterium]
MLSRTVRREARKRIGNPLREAVRRAAEQWCPECQKRVQPFHLCMVRTDFRQRKAEAGRQVRRGGGPETARGGRRDARTAHDYQTCPDRGCPRPLCRAFREGQLACPLPHQG